MLEYPQQADNHAPYGGPPAAWRSWAEALTLSRSFALTCPEIGPGRTVLVLEQAPVPLNPIGAVHGGIVAAVADQAKGVAFVAMPEGTLPATASLSVEYHRPALLPVTFTAEVTCAGRTMVFVSVEVRGGDGKVTNDCRGIMAVRRTT